METDTASLMYPFGLDAGDRSGTFTDCNNGFTTIPLTPSTGFPFLGQTRNNVYVSIDKKMNKLKTRKTNK